MATHGSKLRQDLQQAMEDLTASGFRLDLDRGTLKHAERVTGFNIDNIRVWIKLQIAPFGDAMCSREFSWSELRPFTFKRNEDLRAKVISGEVPIRVALRRISQERDEQTGQSALRRAKRTESTRRRMGEA